MAAVGTLCVWVGHVRPRFEWLSYLIKGSSAKPGPLPKIRVHVFPIEEALAHVEGRVSRHGAHPTVAERLYTVLACLLLVWLHRPHSLVSVRGDEPCMP